MEIFSTKLITATTLLLIGLNFNLRAQIQKNNIYGDWQVDYEETLALQTDMAKQLFTHVPGEHKSAIQNDMSSRHIVYDTQGSFQTLIGGENIDGSWEWLSDSTTTFVSLDNGDQFKHRFIETSGDHLIIQLHEETDSTTLFHYWCLNKIN
ncbi:MAG: hypothetical protein AAF363_00195 [Bacteroidota bacterium]